MNPTVSRRTFPFNSAEAFPQICDVPESGFCNPTSAVNSELLPAPFRPINATISPARTVAFKDFNTTFDPYLMVKSFANIRSAPRVGKMFSTSLPSSLMVSVIRLTSRTLNPTSESPNALAKCTMGGAISASLRIISGKSILAFPSPAI